MKSKKIKFFFNKPQLLVNEFQYLLVLSEHRHFVKLFTFWQVSDVKHSLSFVQDAFATPFVSICFYLNKSYILLEIIS